MPSTPVRFAVHGSLETVDRGILTLWFGEKWPEWGRACARPDCRIQGSGTSGEGAAFGSLAARHLPSGWLSASSRAVTRGLEQGMESGRLRPARRWSQSIPTGWPQYVVLVRESVKRECKVGIEQAHPVPAPARAFERQPAPRRPGSGDQRAASAFWTLRPDGVLDGCEHGRGRTGAPVSVQRIVISECYSSSVGNTEEGWLDRVDQH